MNAITVYVLQAVVMNVAVVNVGEQSRFTAFLTLVFSSLSMPKTAVIAQASRQRLPVIVPRLIHVHQNLSVPLPAVDQTGSGAMPSYHLMFPVY